MGWTEVEVRVATRVFVMYRSGYAIRSRLRTVCRKCLHVNLSSTITTPKVHVNIMGHFSCTRTTWFIVCRATNVHRQWHWGDWTQVGVPLWWAPQRCHQREKWPSCTCSLHPSQSYIGGHEGGFIEGSVLSTEWTRKQRHACLSRITPYFYWEITWRDELVINSITSLLFLGWRLKKYPKITLIKSFLQICFRLSNILNS